MKQILFIVLISAVACWAQSKAGWLGGDEQQPKSTPASPQPKAATPSTPPKAVTTPTPAPSTNANSPRTAVTPTPRAVAPPPQMSLEQMNNQIQQSGNALIQGITAAFEQKARQEAERQANIIPFEVTFGPEGKVTARYPSGGGVPAVVDFPGNSIAQSLDNALDQHLDGRGRNMADSLLSALDANTGGQAMVRDLNAALDRLDNDDAQISSTGSLIAALDSWHSTQGSQTIDRWTAVALDAAWSGRGWAQKNFGGITSGRAIEITEAGGAAVVELQKITDFGGFAQRAFDGKMTSEDRVQAINQYGKTLMPSGDEVAATGRKELLLSGENAVNVAGDGLNLMDRTSAPVEGEIEAFDNQLDRAGKIAQDIPMKVAREMCNGRQLCDTVLNIIERAKQMKDKVEYVVKVIPVLPGAIAKTWNETISEGQQ